MNTAMFTFNWKLPEREIPHWREVVICITIYAIYIAVYRFILCRLPILYQWKTADEAVPALEPSRSSLASDKPAPAAAGTYRNRMKESIPAPGCTSAGE